MATDLDQIVASLTGFYGFADRTVVEVGAGGGQLVEFARPARRVIAVDNDVAALERLAARLKAVGLADKYTAVHADFLRARPRGDVLVFEFCLHQMADPERALAHAARLAPDVVVVDHAPGSKWSWYAGEDRMVERAWAAVAAGKPMRRHLDVEGVQRFRDYAELSARLAGQGPVSLERTRDLEGQAPITIPMPYRLALV